MRDSQYPRRNQELAFCAKEFLYFLLVLLFLSHLVRLIFDAFSGHYGPHGATEGIRKQQGLPHRGTDLGMAALGAGSKITPGL